MQFFISRAISKAVPAIVGAAGTAAAAYGLGWIVVDPSAGLVCVSVEALALLAAGTFGAGPANNARKNLPQARTTSW